MTARNAAIVVRKTIFSGTLTSMNFSYTRRTISRSRSSRKKKSSFAFSNRKLTMSIVVSIILAIAMPFCPHFLFPSIGRTPGLHDI